VKTKEGGGMPDNENQNNNSFQDNSDMQEETTRDESALTDNSQPLEEPGYGPEHYNDMTAEEDAEEPDQFNGVNLTDLFTDESSDLKEGRDRNPEV
jgi:hypothetical protein